VAMAVKVQAFFLVWHVAKCAGEQCSDSLGSCGSTPRASLMQTRSLTKQALSAVEASATRAQTLAQFKEYTNNLVAEYLKGGKSMASDLDTAIDTIITYIDAMKLDLKQWDSADRAMCADCQVDKRDRVCTEQHINATVLQDLQSAVDRVQTAREDHAECRQKCGPDSCPYGQCPDYHEYRKNDVHKKALWSHMVKCANPPPGHLADDYIRADESENNGKKLSDMEACLKKAKVWLDPLYELYSACEYVENHCPTCQAECDEKQSDFEVQHCQLDIERGDHCDGFYICWDDDWTTCDQKVSNMLDREKARAADYETGERIRCLLNVLRDATDDADKPAELAKCNEDDQYIPYGPKNEFYINCSIGTKIPPAHMPCGLSEMQPCDDEFLRTEYYDGLGLSAYKADEYQYEEGVAAGNFGMVGQCQKCNHKRTHHFMNQLNQAEVPISFDPSMEGGFGQ